MHRGSYSAFPSASPIQQKLVTFSHILGTLNNNFKPILVLKVSRMKVYNALAVPILVYGSEI